MTPENFCYWLRGRTENRDLEPPTQDDWQLIIDHLGMVFGVLPPVRGPVVGDLEMDPMEELAGLREAFNTPNGAEGKPKLIC